MIQELREIAWSVLGRLDEEGVRGTCIWDKGEREAKVWAIGHWYVTSGCQAVAPPSIILGAISDIGMLKIVLMISHIDTAWLWRYTQTQQKVRPIPLSLSLSSLNSSSYACSDQYHEPRATPSRPIGLADVQIARSWTTQCDLMDRFPNHQFAASSAQQYTWLESLYPKAFERVQKYIKQGRFHYVGGAWLEHDCMIPSGESLIRQYLYGQRYFKRKFGEYCREAWLPDTFGYASQLPQILRLAGLTYFFTQKVSERPKVARGSGRVAVGREGCRSRTGISDSPGNQRPSWEPADDTDQLE